jgi:hypothetical protein
MLFLEPEVSEYVRGLETSSHSICPFDDQEFRNQVFVEYVRGAIERNQAITHVSNDVPRDKHLISECFPKKKIDGQIRILPVEAAYDLSGFSFDKMLKFWEEQRVDALRHGFVGLHGSADVEAVLSQGYSSEMLKGEDTVGRVIAAEGLMFLCFYRVSALPRPESLLGLFSAHGHVIFPGLAGRLY